MLKRILSEWRVKVWNVLVSSECRPVAGFLKHDNEPSDSKHTAESLYQLVDE